MEIFFLISRVLKNDCETQAFLAFFCLKIEWGLIRNSGD